MFNIEALTCRQRLVFNQVSHLYENSLRKEACWMWKNHVQWVASKCLELATKYNADIDQCFAGGLLHDLGDVWFERNDPRYEPTTQSEIRKILENAKFSSDEIVNIIVRITNPHSCGQGDEQTTIEGKILATADALSHIQTNFLSEFKKMGWPQNINSKNFNEWALDKLNKDFNKKIFFPEIREEVRSIYEELKVKLSKVDKF